MAMESVMPARWLLVSVCLLILRWYVEATGSVWQQTRVNAMVTGPVQTVHRQYSAMVLTIMTRQSATDTENVLLTAPANAMKTGAELIAKIIRESCVLACFKMIRPSALDTESVKTMVPAHVMNTGQVMNVKRKSCVTVCLAVMKTSAADSENVSLTAPAIVMKAGMELIVIYQ